jgi:hypothetical protein
MEQNPSWEANRFAASQDIPQTTYTMAAPLDYNVTTF